MLSIHDSSLELTNQNLVKIKSPHINTFGYNKLTIFNAMRDLTIGVCEHLDITAKMDVDQKVK